MSATKESDRLGTVEDTGFGTGWNFKEEYVTGLNDGQSYERFSQFSATPDTTVLFAGPARFNGLAGDSSVLMPIGLVDNIQMSSGSQLTQMYEIGSNRSFFTRGKTQHSITLSKMLADQQNILQALTKNAYRPDINSSGQSAPGSDGSNIMLNLDSEYFNVPFGLMLLFKTRGGNGGEGKVLAATYLEYCMFSNYSFAVAAASPVIAENISIQYDRPVPVTFN